MYDKGKIIPGLIIFVVLFTFPIWFTLAFGKTGAKPEPRLPTKPGHKEHCVESKDYMKRWHMDLLNNWRDSVVRDKQRVYISQTIKDKQGKPKKFNMSLSNGCMKCHNSRKQFCNKCHVYVGVDPYCWKCHVEPK